MSIVAETYSFVVGVDTHAATHSYAIVIECSDSTRQIGSTPKRSL